MSLDVAAPSNSQNYIDGVSSSSYSANHAQHSPGYDHQSPKLDSKLDRFQESGVSVKQESPNTHVSPLQENYVMRNPAVSPVVSSPSSQSLPQCSEYASKRETAEGCSGISSLREALNQPQVYSNVDSLHKHSVPITNDLRTNFRIFSAPEQQSYQDGTVSNTRETRENLEETSPKKRDVPLNFSAQNSHQVNSQPDSVSEAIHSSKNEHEYQRFLASSRHSDSGSHDDEASQPSSLLSAYHGETRDSFLGLTGALGKQELFYCHLCNYIGNSKFLFNEHMNSHFEHQCPHCDYTSRTEGRLKRHIKDFHSPTPPENYSGNRVMKPDASPQQQQTVPQREKVYRCKQCDFVALQKAEFWEHARSHIKADKVLQCPKCPFVTEYKHHLEYHLRNHFGSKPFKCNKCNYSCVNKSMLNSHMKSHTNVYQYRCADCTYATKYCHSLKLHLRKYNHKPATVLNSDGSLPTDGSGDFELVSKRGPPRGPRGPRKERDMPNMHMSPIAGGLSPNMLLHQAAAVNGLHPHSFNAASLAASAFWPLLGQFPNGLQPPPPLVPAAGLGMFPGGLHPPTTPTPEAKASLHKERQSQKCNMCEYIAESMTELNQHMLKVHAAENNDLFSMFGISQEALEEHASKNRALASHYSQMLPATPKAKQLLSMSQIKSEPPSDQKSPCSPKSSLLSTPRSWPTPASHSPPSEMKTPYPSTPYMDKDSPLDISLSGGSARPLSSSKKAIAEDLAASIEAEVRQNGEIPLDLTKPKGCNGENGFALQNMLGPENSAKRKLDYGPPSPSQDKGASTSPVPVRKRSRKGQAFKLDTICMKLQERCTSSPTQGSGYESNEEYMSDYASEKGEEGNISTSGAPDEPAEGNGESNSPKKDEDNQSNIDYLEIHNNLRELNQNSDEDMTREYPFDMPQSSQSQSEKAEDANGGESKNNNQAEPSPGINRRKLFVVRRNEMSQDTMPEDHVSSQVSDNSSDEMDDIPTDTEPHKSDNAYPSYECQYCQISFRDCVMYTMHIGYHGYQDPFKCNMCGHQSSNRVDFFLHIAREPHAFHGQPM